MQNTTPQEKDFNYFDFFKFKVLKQYFTNKFNGLNTNEFNVEINYFDNNKSTYFAKNNALKFVKWESDYDETGKQITIITIKDLNLNAKAISKENKPYNIFNSFDIAKAVKSALK